MSMSGSLGFDLGSCCIIVGFKLGGTCISMLAERSWICCTDIAWNKFKKRSTVMAVFNDGSFCILPV